MTERRTILTAFLVSFASVQLTLWRTEHVLVTLSTACAALLFVLSSRPPGEPEPILEGAARITIVVALLACLGVEATASGGVVGALALSIALVGGFRAVTGVDAV